ncbi:DUF2272 domain-containing protein [Lysobacter solisilvae (ex Woo and Kim 2020)]|uniref:DUF2272 domain-containing protein n=1 Tax=Agrilutibacter terrestris TaxID=2865112 RepID=A0A7H0FX97_9GAMM|nr:DUF2272 domain-containing protein [Lysobacter terrestris]QNP40663.1 DUF2272 domain-containing protein [Lysobacter terrestris]
MDSVRVGKQCIRFAAVLGLLGSGPSAGAQEPAPVAASSPLCSRIAQSPPSYASRIAQVACAENALWFGPFIDTQGRLASITVSEGERLRLQDGATPAWQRVADYWKGSGLLSQMANFPGASDCSVGGGSHFQTSSCRAFLSDTPWSAVFVSFVMARAGVPGFNPSASHIDYIRDAYRYPAASPYVLADPDATMAAAGDLLCFSRGRSDIGANGFRDFLASGSGGMNMHCDIVVAANPDGDGKLYLVGGNVLQGVTMRVLPLNRTGAIWGLPRRIAAPGACQPGSEGPCSFNRQDWVTLMKLKPLPVPNHLAPIPTTPPQCCTQCPLPLPEHLRRCPPLQRPVDALPGGQGR